LNFVTILLFSLIDLALVTQEFCKITLEFIGKGVSNTKIYIGAASKLIQIFGNILAKLQNISIYNR